MRKKEQSEKMEETRKRGQIYFSSRKNRSDPFFLVPIFCLVFSLVFSGTCFGGGFYRYNIDDLARKARQRIKEIERKIEEEEIRGELEEVFLEVQPLFEEAESLLKVGKLEEAAELYRKIDKLSKKSEVKKALKRAEEF